VLLFFPEQQKKGLKSIIRKQIDTHCTEVERKVFNDNNSWPRGIAEFDVFQSNFSFDRLGFES
jgi:hypothetical protein